MPLPVVTIGIPTLNRANTFLKESLASVFAQTYPNLQILVSDNASTDNTEEVVREIGKGRIGYFRHPVNIGAAANWRNLAVQATGKYFVWLQDDDMIMPDFVARAVDAMERFEDAVAYLAYVIHTTCPATLNGTVSFWGPPLPLNWITSEPLKVSGDFITPASMFSSVASPPNVLFRRSALTEDVVNAYCDDRYPVFAEAVGLAKLTYGKYVVAAPQLAAIHRVHGDQNSRSWLGAQEEFQRSRIAAGDVLNEIWGECDVTQCPEFTRILAELPNERLQSLFRPWVQVFDRSPPNRLSLQVKSILQHELERRQLPPAPMLPDETRLLSGFRKLRRQTGILCQEVCPPILFRGIRRLVNAALGE